MRSALILALAMLAGAAQSIEAAPLVCPRGEPVAADIGAGAVMRSCVWEKSPGVRVRSGPLELYKNGILILKTQTNADGKLHGAYTAWSDDGVLQEQGRYVDGLKEGVWMEATEGGKGVSIRYRNGLPVDR